MKKLFSLLLALTLLCAAVNLAWVLAVRIEPFSDGNSRDGRGNRPRGSAACVLPREGG